MDREIQKSKFKIRNLKKGFTLIEILVVITIIGMLMALALVGLAGAQKQARDTQRKSDLAQVRNAVQAYSANHAGKFPGFNESLRPLTNNLCVSSEPANVLAYLENTCPTDPIGSGNCDDSPTPGKIYCYYKNGSTDGPTSTRYVLTAGLEGGGWWEICSNGMVGVVTTRPTDATCDLGSDDG